jgi:hypothetical protein
MSAPILLTPPPPKADSGQQHVTRLTTTDGAYHYLINDFTVPMRDGVPDLSGKPVDYRASALAGVLRAISGAQTAPFASALGREVNVSPVLEVAGGALVLLTHITAVTHLGRLKGREDANALLFVEHPDGVTHSYTYSHDIHLDHLDMEAS